MLKEFQKFIMKGNVMDLAVAVIIGAAFSAIVKSLVEDIITPGILSPVMSSMNLEKLDELIWLKMAYGKFLAAVINFFVIGVVIFILVKLISIAQKKIEQRFAGEKEEQEAKPPAPTELELLAEIRDLLKAQRGET